MRKRNFGTQIFLRIIAIIVGVGALYFSSPHAGFTKSATLPSQAEEKEKVLYGNRTPECRNPQLIHLCSDYDADGLDRIFSNHQFSVTCDDSCGNVYRFTTTMRFSKHKEWDLEDERSSSLSDIEILKRASLTSRDQEERDDLDRKLQELRDKEKKLGYQGSDIWTQTLSQYPAPPTKEPVQTSFSLESNIPAGMAEALSGEPNPVSGYLSQIAAATVAIQQLIQQSRSGDPAENLVRETQMTVLMRTFDFLKNNEGTIDSSDNPSFLYLDDLQLLAKDITNAEGVVPAAAASVIEALSNNSSLAALLDEEEKVKDQKYDIYQKENEADEQADGRSKDLNQKERCLLYHAGPYEAYPKYSVPLAKKLSDFAEKVTPQIDQMGALAKQYNEAFLDSLRKRFIGPADLSFFFLA